MGGDDFQKRGTGLDLRDAIANARKSHEDAAENRARELYAEMDIVTRVIATIDNGGEVCYHSFPEEVQSKKAYVQYSGEVNWGRVMQKFTELLQEQGVEAEIQTTGDDYYHSVILSF